MRRTFLLPLIAVSVVCISASARLGAAQSAAGKKPPPDRRAKIIDELRADFNDVVDEFAKKNVNEPMRAKQQRIIDNLKRLSEDDEPPAHPGGNPARDNASKPPPPSPPKANPPVPEPNPEKAPVPAPKNPSSKPLPGNAGEREASPRTIDELRKEKNHGYAWPPLPPRQREAIDAHARDRFPPRYEELLRGYYRSIAESGRRGAEE